MVTGKVIQVVEGMLSQTEEVLSFLLLQIVGFDGDAEGEDGTASLEKGERGGQCQHSVSTTNDLLNRWKKTREQTLPSAQSSMSSSGSFAR